MNYDFIHVNSQNRDSGSNSSTDFSYTLKEGFKAIGIQLQQLQLPYTYYNVNSNNNTLIVNWNSVNNTITITPGNYTLTSLTAALNTALGNINSNITCTLNSTNWTLTFSFASASPNTGSLILSQSTINRLIGFQTTTNTSSAQTLTSTSVPTFNDQNLLFINIDNIGTNVLSNNSLATSFNFYVPINVNGGDLLTYTPSLDYENRMQCNINTNFVTLRIRVYDIYGNLLNLNGSDWSMILKVFYKDKII